MATPYGNAYVPKVAVKTVGTTAAAIATANQIVTWFLIQNPSSATGVLRIGGSNLDATANITLGAGDSFDSNVIREGRSPAQYDLSGWYLQSNVATVKARIFKVVKQLQA